MTKKERQIIKHELELTYRCTLKNFYNDSKSEEYNRSVTRLVQLECLAVTLCPKNTSVEEYFEWKLNWPDTCDDLGKVTPTIQWRKNK